MRIACPACETTAEVEGLVPLEGGFGFVCPACARPQVLAPIAPIPAQIPAPAEARIPAPVQARIPATAPAAAPAPEALQEVTPPRPPRVGPPPGQVACPKCGHWQADPGFCHRCGLDLVRASQGTVSLPGDPLKGHPLADHARSAWARIADQIEDREAHRAFISLCAEHGLLEFAGQCYRRASADAQGLPGGGPVLEPEDAEWAARRALIETRLAEYRQRVVQAAMARIGTRNTSIQCWRSHCSMAFQNIKLTMIAST